MKAPNTVFSIFNKKTAQKTLTAGDFLNELVHNTHFWKQGKLEQPFEKEIRNRYQEFEDVLQGASPNLK